MPSGILTDGTPPKGAKGQINIKALPIPDKGVVFYQDKHEKAPKGLMLKVASSGAKTWVLRYQVNGQQRRYTIGHYPDIKPGGARIKADDIKSDIRANGEDGDPIAVREAEGQARIEAEAAKLKTKEQTLGKLLDGYVEQLEKKGKTSARAVENCLHKNVKTAFQKLWVTPAEDIDPDDCVDIVARLTDADKIREAAKLRSYLRAAYTAAIKARHDPSAAPALRKYRLKVNPAAVLATIEGNVRARDRVLSLPELRLYWKRISALPDPDGAVLRFHLLTGGQRLEQLFRLTDRDLDGDDVTLLDPKGRRKEPRVHVVPLLPKAKAALEAIGNGPCLVSFDGGKSPATDAMFRARVRAVCDAMLDAGEISEPFTPGDLRRTVETRLAAAKVSSEHLKHLLSHGFGGVQDRHYQRYEFHAEKLLALKTLLALLEEPPGDVVKMESRKRRADA